MILLEVILTLSFSATNQSDILNFISHTTWSFKLLWEKRSQSNTSNSTLYYLQYSSTQIRPSSLDVAFVDYDGVRFHLSTPERKTLLLLSMHIRCWDELVRYGALEVLQREYGALLQPQAEPEYNVSLAIDLEQIPAGPGAQIQNFIICAAFHWQRSRGTGSLHSINRSVQA